MISICISILVPLPPHDRKYFSIKTANTCIFSTVNRKQKFLSAVSHTQNLDLAVNRKPYTWPPSTKKQKRNKSKFVTKFVITISVASVIICCYSGKNISQTANKNFAKHSFLNDHMNHKNENKTTCRTPPANPHQLWAH